MNMCHVLLLFLDMYTGEENCRLKGINSLKVAFGNGIRAVCSAKWTDNTLVYTKCHVSSRKSYLQSAY